MRILLAEDDDMIAEALTGSLKDAGYAADRVADGIAADSALRAQQYDLLLLDLGLPRRDGLDVLAKIRGSGNSLPVLILTARDDIGSRLAGLDGGADDYLVKPFDTAELLRRRGGHASALLSNGAVTLDPATRSVSVAGQPENIILSNKEFALLQALMLRPGMIFSRADLEDKLYGWGEEVESNAVDFLIHGLRKKIGKEHIKNVRGAGWLVPKEGA